MRINTGMLVKSLIFMAVILSAVVLGQLWFTFLSDDVFVKVIVTIVVLGVLVSFILAVSSDMAEDKKLKDDNYID